MADVTFRYNRAPTGELSGESLVSQTEQALSEISGESSHAEEEAARAVEIATAADGKADQAVATARQAQSTANSALTTAQSAQSSANQAVQTAQGAQTTAQSAVQTAQNAVSTATSAQTAAQSAQTAAENAESNASDAASAAEASATSASAAQTAAETAQADADTAAGLATQAQEAAALSAQAADEARAAAIAAVSVVGAYMYFSGDSVPPHYLLCNGAAVSRDDYAGLYAVIGDKYGAGDGSTTFNLPNLIDKFLEGSGTSGTEIAAGLPNITGEVGRVSTYNAYATISVTSGAFGAIRPETVQTVGTQTRSANINTSADFDASRSNPIYGNSVTVQPPALTALPCIRYE